MTDTILIINGPNLDMLGTRQPEVYGHDTLADVEALCQRTAEDEGVAIDFRQSDSETEIMSWIKQGRGVTAGLILNPAGFTSTSIAILDALLIYDLQLSRCIYRRCSVATSSGSSPTPPRPPRPRSRAAASGVTNSRCANWPNGRGVDPAAQPKPSSSRM